MNKVKDKEHWRESLGRTIATTGMDFSFEPMTLENLKRAWRRFGKKLKKSIPEIAIASWEDEEKWKSSMKWEEQPCVWILEWERQKDKKHHFNRDV